VSSNMATSGGIGARVPRRELKRLLGGQGRYIDDVKLPRMVHAAFVRSPYPHVRVLAINSEEAKRASGVVAVFTAAEINPKCEPFVGVALHRSGHRSAPQLLLASDRAVWQGQPVAVVIATTRAEAEDAAELVRIDWEPLPAVTDQMVALAPGAPVIHPELGDNLAFDFSLEKGDPAKAFADADFVIEEELRFERQMAMTLEARGLVADFNPSDGSLTVIHGHQSPFQMQEVFSRHLQIPEHKVRVIAPDIGGGFGMKLNIYSDEIATVVASMLLGQPVKFCVDRLESFTSDAQARDHWITCRIAIKDGRIDAMELDDIGAVGAYGMPMRFNIAEGMMAITVAGAPYAFENYKARTRSVYVNKNLIGMYRGVGMPLACVATELLADWAAERLGFDPVEFKRRSYWPKSALPCITPGGLRLETVSFHECLEKLVEIIDYPRLRKEQQELRIRGIIRGIGIATFCEQTAYGPPYYGPSGASISTQDGCNIRLDPSGAVRCITSLTDQGQGTLTAVAQIVAGSLGVPIDQVSVMGGDSSISPYGCKPPSGTNLTELDTNRGVEAWNPVGLRTR
jgi:carbon-monoxide dehydrogenase large subunit